MIIKKPRKWKYQLLIAESIAVIMLFFLGASLVNAQTVSNTKITYTLTGSCTLTVVFPYDLNEQWSTYWGGGNVGASIKQYAGTHPSTLNPEGSKIGYTNGTLGDWYSEWQQGYNGGLDGTINGNSVSWSDIGSHASGAWYWYWASPDGGYYAQFYNNGDGTCEPVNSATAEISPLTFNTQITGATATGTASTSISINTSYFLDTAEYTPDNRPDTIFINIISNSGEWNGYNVTSGQRLILPLTDGSHTKNVPLEWIQDPGGFPDGDYFAYVNFWNINRDTFTFSETGAIVSFEILGGQVVASNIEALDTGTALPDVNQYQECSFSNISGCFQNALIFTLVPSADAFDQFTSLYERIETKPPFGYVTSLKNALSGVSNSGTPAFSFGSIPFQDDIFDPFKAIMVIGLWLLYALFFMGRVNKLDI